MYCIIARIIVFSEVKLVNNSIYIFSSVNTYNVHIPTRDQGRRKKFIFEDMSDTSTPPDCCGPAVGFFLLTVVFIGEASVKVNPAVRKLKRSKYLGVFRLF